MMGDEGASPSSSGNVMEYRGFHLDKASVIKEAPYRGDNLGSKLEYRDNRLIGDEVEVSLPVALLDIGEPVPFLRQGLK